MRFRRQIKLEHGLRQIDLAPLIDVVFLLLIFFLLSSSFLTQPVIKVNLPRAMTSEAIQQENAEIMVLADNATYLNGKVVTVGQLKNAIKEVAKRNQSVLIKSDKRAALGKIVEIWDLCRDAGVAQINIATNK